MLGQTKGRVDWSTVFCSPGPTPFTVSAEPGGTLGGSVSQHARKTGPSAWGALREDKTAERASLQRRRIRHEDERMRAGRSAHHLARRREAGPRASLRFVTKRTKRHTYATIHNPETGRSGHIQSRCSRRMAGNPKLQATTLSPIQWVDYVERRHSLVVRIPRCGRGDLGSIPSGVTIFVG